MLVLGVPEYRLPREVVQAEIKAIESLGVEIRHGQRLGRDFILSDLKQQGYEAIVDTPDSFGALMRSETERYARLIETAGIPREP